MMRFVMCAALLCASAASAQNLQVDGAYVPVAPPGVLSHAAYLRIQNTSDTRRSLIGVAAEGYAMAHLHKSEELQGIATMSMLHQLDITPGQTVALMPGGIHIMLMRPATPVAVGDRVALTLTFANGEELSVDAIVEARGYGS